MDEDKRFPDQLQTSWSEGLGVGKTGSCSGGQSQAQEIFNPIVCWWMGLFSLLVVRPEATQSEIYRLYGRANGDLEEDLSQHPPPRTDAASASVNAVGHYQPMPPQKTLKHSQSGLAQSPVGSLVCTKVFLCPPRVCFSHSCGSNINKSCWLSKPEPLGIPTLCAGFPAWEVWCGAWNLHNTVRTSLVLFFSSCRSLTQQVWNLILTWLPLFYHLVVDSSLFLDMGCLFLVASHILLLMVVQQLVVILVFSQEKWAHVLLLHHLGIEGMQL